MSIKTVAITGASGFIAHWVVRYCLEQGLVVHGTVRDLTNTDKCQSLVKLQKAFPNQLHLFEADLLKTESFDAAFKNVDAVIHTASPVNFVTKNPKKDLMEPAVEGTRNVVSSILKNPKIKKWVMTSSVAAIRSSHGTKDLLTEDDWNDDQELNYATSKAQAERLAWQLSDQHQLDLVTINPSVVLGPSLSDRLDAPSHTLIEPLFNGKFTWGVPNMVFSIVDVRDVARAHLNALLTPEAKGRHILASGQLTFWEATKHLKKHLNLPKLPKFPLPNWLVILVGPWVTKSQGNAGVSRALIRRYLSKKPDYDAAKSINQLGIKYRSPEDALLDHITCLQKLTQNKSN